LVLKVKYKNQLVHHDFIVSNTGNSLEDSVFLAQIKTYILTHLNLIKMIKSIIKITVALSVFATFTACSGSAEDVDVDALVDEISEEISEPEEEEEVEESPYGPLQGIIGEWTADAATAGVKIDLTFNEDGSFAQSMGPDHQQEGNWVKVDDEHINITTPNTNEGGQKWKVSNLTEETVDFTWNLDKNPKTIPMMRVQ
jgi:hypothetical protein